MTRVSWESNHQTTRPFRCTGFKTHRPWSFFSQIGSRFFWMSMFSKQPISGFWTTEMIFGWPQKKARRHPHKKKGTAWDQYATSSSCFMILYCIEVLGLLNGEWILGVIGTGVPETKTGVLILWFLGSESRTHPKSKPRLHPVTPSQLPQAELPFLKGIEALSFKDTYKSSCDGQNPILLINIEHPLNGPTYEQVLY